MQVYSLYQSNDGGNMKLVSKNKILFLSILVTLMATAFFYLGRTANQAFAIAVFASLGYLPAMYIDSIFGDMVDEVVTSFKATVVDMYVVLANGMDDENESD